MTFLNSPHHLTKCLSKNVSLCVEAALLWEDDISCAHKKGMKEEDFLQELELGHGWA